MGKPIIFSGIQPTGNLHIGNYLGAVKNWVALQESEEYDCLFSIVDYHSLTGNLSAEERKGYIRTLAAELLAVGIDPEKATLFVQSHVHGHADLSWIFHTVTPVAELERMTQFKDKSAKQTKNINAGLLTYPILQAADILLYHGTLVPVGEDQVQHIELTRDIARWFNNRYGEYFAETQPLLTHLPRVKSLLEPIKKMSKSAGEGHVISLADEPAVIEKKIKKAVTATDGGDEAPGVQNLLLLLKEFGDISLHQSFVAAQQDGSIRYGDLKNAVSDALINTLTPFQERRAAWLAKPQELDDVLAAGAAKAQRVATKTLEEVRERVGL